MIDAFSRVPTIRSVTFRTATLFPRHYDRLHFVCWTLRLVKPYGVDTSFDAATWCSQKLIQWSNLLQHTRTPCPHFVHTKVIFRQKCTHAREFLFITGKKEEKYFLILVLISSRQPHAKSFMLIQQSLVSPTTIKSYVLATHSPRHYT